MIHLTSNIQWAGSPYKSFVILDQDKEIILVPSLFIAHLAINGKSQNTIKSFAEKIDQYFKILNSSQNTNWETVDNETLSIYINQFLFKHLNLKPRSIRIHITAILKFYTWAWEYGFIEDQPSFNLILDNQLLKNKERGVGSKNYIQQYIEQENFEDLLGNLSTSNPYLLERNELIMNLGYQMGLRASEVIDHRNLKIDNLYKTVQSKGKSYYIDIIGKGEKVRRVPCSPSLTNKIINFMHGQHHSVNSKNLISDLQGNPLNRVRPNEIFKQSKKNLDKSYWESRTFHSLRHTFATNLVAWCYENNFNPWDVVPESMGHSDVETTKGYIFFEAVLSKRHSLIEKLNIK